MWLEPSSDIGNHLATSCRSGLNQRRLPLKHWARDYVPRTHGALSASNLFPRLSLPEPRGVGKLLSEMTSAFHDDLQSQSRPSNSPRLPETEYLSMAATTSASQMPQLWDPLNLPPAVGCTITRQSRSERDSCEVVIISTNDHSHGVLYSLFLNSLSTIVFFCIFMGFTETSSEKGATSISHEVVWLSASPSDMKGGLNKR